MRRIAISVSCLVFVLGACGSDKKEVSATTTTRTRSTTTSTTPPAATPPPTPTAVATTTRETCPNSGTSDARLTTSAQPAALLTKVAVTNVDCRDSVTFTFKKSGSAVPSCKVEYQPGPFTKDGSGQPVTVAGTAFVSVRCEPAYGYDFESDTTTYTGPEHITPTATRHVREVVETGDFEGVLNWVIGLDAKRSFAITAGGTPTRQLIITFS
jgi:hypothetical protein